MYVLVCAHSLMKWVVCEPVPYRKTLVETQNRLQHTHPKTLPPVPSRSPAHAGSPRLADASKMGGHILGFKKECHTQCRQEGKTLSFVLDTYMYTHAEIDTNTNKQITKIKVHTHTHTHIHTRTKRERAGERFPSQDMVGLQAGHVG